MKRQRKRRANETASAIASPQPGKQAKLPEGSVAKAPSSRVWPWLLGFLLLVSTFVAYLPALRGGFVWDDDSWTLRLSGLFQSASGLRWILVPTHRAATILPAHGYDLLAGLSTLEVLDAALPCGEHSAARPGGPVVLAAVGPAPTAGRVAGRGTLRPPPGYGRIRRVDHRTQERAFPEPLSCVAPGLRAVCAVGDG